MPSDDRTVAALAALAEPRASFRTAVAVARDQMSAYLAAHRPVAAEAPGVPPELGRFASGRIDGSRFAGLFAGDAALADETSERVEQCIAVLDELLARGDDLFVCTLGAGGDLWDEVDAAFADIGRTFGAVLAFQAAKARTWRADYHPSLLRSFPFSRWNRSERLLAPPIVVELDGADLRGEQLVDHLDGRVRIVLVARGASAPAPLARLITPGTFVMQATDASELGLLVATTGPGVAALLPDGAARFVHTPRAGSSPRERLRIDHLPTVAPRHMLGGRSAVQQREELEQLTELSRWPDAVAAPATAEAGTQAPAAAPPIVAGAATPAQTVDALASWLLGAAGFTGTTTPDGARS